MGRKSIAEERREEILAAFERCIGRYGLDVPLERIAEEAGVQRSLIRHYLGNRDEVVEQMIARIAEDYPQRIAAQLTPALEQGAAGLLDLFFGESAIALEWDEVIHAVVSGAHGRHAQAKRRLAQMCVVIIERTAAALAQLYPQAPEEACYETAYAILCLTYANEDLRWLGLDLRHSAMARSQAEHLISALGV